MASSRRITFAGKTPARTVLPESSARFTHPSPANSGHGSDLGSEADGEGSTDDESSHEGFQNPPQRYIVRDGVSVLYNEDAQPHTPVQRTVALPPTPGQSPYYTDDALLRDVLVDDVFESPAGHISRSYALQQPSPAASRGPSPIPQTHLPTARLLTTPENRDRIPSPSAPRRRSAGTRRLESTPTPVPSRRTSQQPLLPSPSIHDGSDDEQQDTWRFIPQRGRSRDDDDWRPPTPDQEDEEYIPVASTSRKRARRVRYTTPQYSDDEDQDERRPTKKRRQVPSPSPTPAPPPLRRRRNRHIRKGERDDDESAPADLPRCEACGFIQRNGRKPDFLRHLRTHESVNDDETSGWWCKGVLVEDAHLWTLRGHTTPYEFASRMRVGGCRGKFSRRDALKRHLDNPRCKCVGSPCKATEEPRLPSRQ
ncbi:hypothetical protein FISHEDRAFT_76429 [Fistulina hepatica ATCC 64428]|uniref:C2H2-type domain-containing protein n=1 Tax=Fistulina hepatica ATCC 64428 TaxID=1128425 RepID=A0A0D7A4B3_9AGAR|nr:hypothetical protein FISHEDRAFT_76429 [Fistulina hepatica ATCC 64428]